MLTAWHDEMAVRSASQPHIITSAPEELGSVRFMKSIYSHTQNLVSALKTECNITKCSRIHALKPKLYSFSSSSEKQLVEQDMLPQEFLAKACARKIRKSEDDKQAEETPISPSRHREWSLKQRQIHCYLCEVDLLRIPDHMRSHDSAIPPPLRRCHEPPANKLKAPISRPKAHVAHSGHNVLSPVLAIKELLPPGDTETLPPAYVTVFPPILTTKPQLVSEVDPSLALRRDISAIATSTHSKLSGRRSQLPPLVTPLSSCAPVPVVPENSTFRADSPLEPLSPPSQINNLTSLAQVAASKQISQEVSLNSSSLADVSAISESPVLSTTTTISAPARHKSLNIANIIKGRKRSRHISLPTTARTRAKSPPPPPRRVSSMYLSQRHPAPHRTRQGQKTVYTFNFPLPPPGPPMSVTPLLGMPTQKGAYFQFLVRRNAETEDRLWTTLLQGAMMEKCVRDLCVAVGRIYFSNMGEKLWMKARAELWNVSRAVKILNHYLYIGGDALKTVVRFLMRKLKRDAIEGGWNLKRSPPVKV